MILRVESCWAVVHSQLDLTRELESTMTDEYRDIQARILRVLRGKLDVAIQKLSNFARPAPLNVVKKLKFVFLRDALNGVVNELETWQKLYEPAWFQLIKIAPSTVIDVRLKNIIVAGPKAAAESISIARQFHRAFKEASGEPQAAFIREGELAKYNQVSIPCCTATVATRPGDPQQLIVDTVTSGAVQLKDARDFGYRFRSADPFTFGLFSCKGVVRHAKTSEGITFLFRVPAGHTVVGSVRQLLLSGRTHDSLSDRLEMAKQLVSAVYYVHLYGFVHKNIRPETILSLAKTAAGEGPIPCTAFLVGFQVIRNADGRTYPVTDTRWETNLYRHPLRQGTVVDYYVMQHDIYSLGVCLLEIGLWEPFVTYGLDGVAQPSPVLAGGMSRDEDPFALKEHLVTVSRSSALRAKMGNKYSSVVETCLTCLDADNVDFGDEKEFQDEDGVAVGVRYIEKVLGILNGISV